MAYLPIDLKSEIWNLAQNSSPSKTKSTTFYVFFLLIQEFVLFHCPTLMYQIKA